ncbi:MAG: hypothetical protein ACXAEI_06735 [Candidatus Hodarchaeales archaeon]
MIVYAVYIMTSDGKTILSENFQSIEDIPDEQLLGGIISALQAVTAEITQERSEMKSIEIEGLSYHIRSFGTYRVVLVTDVLKTPEDMIIKLGMRFMKEYGEVLADEMLSVPLDTFAPFKKTIYEVVTSETVTDDMKSIKPTKMLSTGEIFSLPHYLQSTALAMISLQEADEAEIAEESGSDPDAAKKNLDELRELGFIGVKMRSGKTTYFCSI